MKTSPTAVKAIRQMIATSAARELRPLGAGEKIPETPIDARVFNAIGLMHDAMTNERKRDRAHKAVISLSNSELRRLEEIVLPVALLHLLAGIGLNASWLWLQTRT